MEQHYLVGLASIVVLGVAAQWLAWRLRIPSILLLLAFGIIAGPVTGFLNPDALLGNLLLPVVSLSVAVILFEGGLSLRLSELKQMGGVFIRLVTLGVAVSWVIIAVAAHWLIGLEWPLAAVFGAILVVTGPTVIGPMLRHLRLGGQVGSILKWEGIVIDPLGAMLAVLVFAVVRVEGVSQAASQFVYGFALTALVGTGLGVLAAFAFVVPLRRYWLPDSLQNAASLAAVFGVFSLANALQAESGLLAVTVMGIGVANQRHVTIRHVVEFKENLRQLLVSGLFLILAARLRLADFRSLDLGCFAFLAILVLVARPATVWISALGSKLSWRERLFLAAMAPRGIVAAAVTSVVALELSAAGMKQADRLTPITFLVIIGTVLLYGLGAPPLARKLGLAQPNPQGVVLVGAHPWARAIATALKGEGLPALLVDSDWSNISAARQAGLSTFFASILAEHTLNEMDVAEMGHLLAVTPNDEVNSLACLRFIDVFGRRGVFQLSFAPRAQGRREAVSLDQRGRFLFQADTTYMHLVERFSEDPILRATRLTKEFGYEDFCKLNGSDSLPLLLISESRALLPFTVVDPPLPQPGQTLISATAVGSSTGREKAADSNVETLVAVNVAAPATA
jgi:NhaP-type Na+/H+ or K+/H+ antiporter